MFIVQISPYTGSADFTLITPRYWNSLVHSLISLGRMQRIFCSCSHSHSTNLSFHLVPITAGWTEAVWIQSLPKASIHGRCCGNRTQHPLTLALTAQPGTPLKTIKWTIFFPSQKSCEKVYNCQGCYFLCIWHFLLKF